MADKMADRELVVADSVMHDGKAWRDRLLSAAPDASARRGFHLGLAMIIAEEMRDAVVPEDLEDQSTLSNAWIQMGRRAFEAVLPPDPEPEDDAE